MKTPAGRQLAGVLAFLKEALNSDRELVTALQVEGQPVVGATMEQSPIGRDVDGKIVAYTSELPALGGYLDDTKAIGTASCDGWRDAVKLVYVVPIPPGQLVDGVAVTGEGLVRRWMGCVGERIQYWLIRHRLPEDAAFGDPVHDMLTRYGIHSIAATSWNYRVTQSYGVLTVTVDLERYDSAWLYTPLSELRTIEGEITQSFTGGAVDGDLTDGFEITTA